MRGRLMRKNCRVLSPNPPFFHCLHIVFSPIHKNAVGESLINSQPVPKIILSFVCGGVNEVIYTSNTIIKFQDYPSLSTNALYDPPTWQTILSLIQGTLCVCTWTILTSKCPHMILFGPKLLPFLSLSASPNRGNVCKTNWNQISAQCQLCPKL